MTTPTKTCTQCGTEYEATLAHFYKFKAPDGLYPRCKSCYKAGRGSRSASTVAFVGPTPAKKPSGKTADDLMKEALARHDANIAKATAKPARKRSPKPDPDTNRHERTVADAKAYRDGPVGRRSRKIIGSTTSGTADLD